MYKFLLLHKQLSNFERLTVNIQLAISNQNQPYQLKKSLGQHFLHNEEICQQIVSFLRNEKMNLLEVGPGAGAITKYLLQNENLNFKCVEFDKEKVDYLLQKHPSLIGKIIHDDFLKISLPFEQEFNIIGNFPYNISSQIVFKILDWKQFVPLTIGMFQKEVAMRIAAKHGNKDYGILSVLVQCFYEVDFLIEVHENSFTPPPKVKSAVIKMIRKQESLLPPEDYSKFKMFVKTAFNQRRKTLRNGLKSILDKSILTNEIFDKRAEQLSVQQFVEMYNTYFRK